jgi:hypothetical protein
LLSKKHDITSINARAWLVPPTTDKKMIAEKEFRTITLRGLDEKPELVKIMNKVMQVQDLKTGQSVIEHIILRYEKLQEEIWEVKQKRDEEKRTYYNWQQKSEEEIEELKKTIGAAQVAFKRILDTKL